MVFFVINIWSVWT